VRVHVVSGRARNGGRAGPVRWRGHADLLGDLLLFLDYEDPSKGIYADLYGADYTREYIALRTAKRFDEARQLTMRLMAQTSAAVGNAAGTGANGPWVAPCAP